jgi:hypothetical protein
MSLGPDDFGTNLDSDDLERVIERLVGTISTLESVLHDIGLDDCFAEVCVRLALRGVRPCAVCCLWFESAEPLICPDCVAIHTGELKSDEADADPHFAGVDFRSWADEDEAVIGEVEFRERMDELVGRYRGDLEALYREAIEVHGEKRPVLVLFSPYEPFGWRIFEAAGRQGIHDPGLAEAVAERDIEHLIVWTVLDPSWVEFFHVLCATHEARAPRDEREFRVVVHDAGQIGAITLRIGE